MLNLTSASIRQLKQYAADNAIVITGDLRRKQSYIDGIITYQASLEAAFAAVSSPEDVVDEDAMPGETPGTCVVRVVIDEDDNIVCVPVPQKSEIRNQKSLPSFAPILLLLIQIVFYATASVGLIVGGCLWVLYKALDGVLDYPAMRQGRIFDREIREVMATL